MKKLLYLIIYLPLILLTACDVHEWPELPERMPLHLKLSYEKDMTVWEHLHDGTDVIEQGLGEIYDNCREYGKIRYIIRAYPMSGQQRTVQEHTQEFVFTKDIREGYEHDVTLELTPGNYNIMVWSDLVESDGKTPYHDASDFAAISLQGDHEGCNDYRDAFRGTGNISLRANVSERVAPTLEITMQRPLAKFEIVTNDLAEFIEKQTLSMASQTNGTKFAPKEEPATKVLFEDCKVVFYYIGFMPDTYSMFTDKPVNSSTGIMFQSSLERLTAGEGTLGFDYVFVNGKTSAVTVQIGIYDNAGTQLSLTGPIEVPLQRSRHTVLRGRFLMSEASSSVTIEPGFDGDHNLIFP